MSKKSNVNNRSGWLLKQDGTAAFARTFVVRGRRDIAGRQHTSMFTSRLIPHPLTEPLRCALSAGAQRSRP
jgi:hypothetical protein